MTIRRHALHRLLVTAVAALLLAGCGDDGAPSGADASPGGPGAGGGGGDRIAACSLLTTDEVTAAVGTPAKDGQIALKMDSICAWDLGDDSSGAVMLSLQTAQQFDVLKQGLSTSQVEGMALEAVSGIGDDAFFQLSERGPVGAALFVMKGNSTPHNAFWLSVTAPLGKEFSLDEQKSRAKTLGQAAAGRL